MSIKNDQKFALFKLIIFNLLKIGNNWQFIRWINKLNF